MATGADFLVNINRLAAMGDAAAALIAEAKRTRGLRYTFLGDSRLADPGLTETIMRFPGFDISTSDTLTAALYRFNAALYLGQRIADHFDEMGAPTNPLIVSRRAQLSAAVKRFRTARADWDRDTV